MDIIDQVSGGYEVLVRVSLMGQERPENACLKDIVLTTTTMLNSKTQPQLHLGRNTIYVGAGDQTDSIVIWPDLQGDRYKAYAIEEHNIASKAKHPGYQGVMYAGKANEDAYVVFRIDAPSDIQQISYGGRFYNRAPKSHIDMLHSFDNGAKWHRSYSLTSTEPPWDVIHYETVRDIPENARSVLFKHLLNSTQAGTDCCSIYSVRMEANHRPPKVDSEPIEVTFNWSEVQQDYSLVARSHTQLITELPFRYTVNVGGCDHPVVNWLRVSSKGAVENTEYGYSDGIDVGGDRYVPQWVSYGSNLAKGCRYQVSAPSKTNWGAGDPEGVKLTDGLVGPHDAGR